MPLNYIYLPYSLQFHHASSSIREARELGELRVALPPSSSPFYPSNQIPPSQVSSRFSPSPYRIPCSPRETIPPSLQFAHSFARSIDERVWEMKKRYCSSSNTLESLAVFVIAVSSSKSPFTTCTSPEGGKEVD